MVISADAALPIHDRTHLTISGERSAGGGVEATLVALQKHDERAGWMRWWMRMKKRMADEQDLLSRRVQRLNSSMFRFSSGQCRRTYVHWPINLDRKISSPLGLALQVAEEDKGL